MRAINSLRLEKSYRMWGQDLTREYTPLEAGFDRFVKLDKGDFTCRDALLRQKEEGVPLEFVTMEVHGGNDADALGNEPLYREGEMIGRATADAYGHHVGKSLAVGYVKTGMGSGVLEIEFLGSRYAATVIAESPYDPQNKSLRG